MVVEYSTIAHHHPTENSVTSAGARDKEDSLPPFHKSALLLALPHHISAIDCERGYPPDQGTRTGRATRGRRAWLAVCRLAERERIRSIAWSWWNARKASATEVSMNLAVVWPSAGADTTPSGMSLDQPLAARNPLTMWEGNPPQKHRFEKSIQAAMASRCLGVMPPKAMFGRSWLYIHIQFVAYSRTSSRSLQWYWDSHS